MIVEAGRYSSDGGSSSGCLVLVRDDANFPKDKLSDEVNLDTVDALFLAPAYSSNG